MNEELVDEIAYQAGCRRVRLPADPKNPDLDGFIINRDVLDKFAELIVRECAAVSRESSKRIDDMGSLIAQDIEKHFGVEE